MMKRILIILFCIIAVGAAGVYFYLKENKLDNFEPKIKDKLTSIVSDASKGLYHIKFDRISVDVINSRVLLHGISLHYDSTQLSVLQHQGRAPGIVTNINLKDLAIDGISPEDIITRKNIRINVLLLDQPEISIRLVARNNSESKAGNTDFISLIQKEIGSIGVKGLEIKNANFKLLDHNGHLKSRLDRVKISLNDLLIDKNTDSDSSRFLYSKYASISLGKMHLKTADSLYLLRADSLYINAVKRSAVITKFEYLPRLSKLEFRNAIKKRKDRYDITVGNISLSNVDWWRFLSEDAISIGTAKLSNIDAEIYSDKAIPAGNESKIGGYPHQQLMKAKRKVNIRHIEISNANIIYSEYNIKTLKQGSILFKKTYGTVNNLCNDINVVNKYPEMTVSARSMFMNEGILKASFKFDLKHYTKGDFTVSADVGKMDGKSLNRATEGLASVRIERVKLDRFHTTITGDNYNAYGKSAIVYSDLKIAALKVDENKKLEKKGLISFIANNFKINRSYPTEDSPKMVTSHYRRPPDKSFFAVLWKTIFEGLKQPVGF